MIAIGLISGTSLDGVDAALVRIEPRAASYAFELLAFRTVPYEPELLAELHAALPPNVSSASAIAQLHHRVGIAFARAARQVAGALGVDYVASHGQTLWHDGAHHTSMQIGDAFVIRETMNASVCYDFRSGDTAAGGHGAPLVPYVDALLFADAAEDRIALNIGGIANLTALPAGCEVHDVLAFDTGPGNMLIDSFVRTRTRGGRAFDPDGTFGARGRVDEEALRAMLGDEYFAQAYPRSTGRERFGEHFLEAHSAMLAPLSVEDGCATLAELTAVTIADSVEKLKISRARILCSGGGVKNLHLMSRLQARLPDADLESTDAYGVPSDAKEAIAFAILGYETLRERAANVPRVTGASRAVPLGAIAPVGLRSLLANVEREWQLS